ncbi:lipopolysaccharide biosynthesis protein [Pseudomonas putida]|uniref:lipopolysaccharide biosynthesis protein n=1 Tax=Pseudomonas putida TaxID=303 RepID=UPI001E2AD408|nr:lipopolysaccharide biosynthesis protein [Pseudomonas putida]MCC9006909.1 lipopolysaccharide biosynthesis protein [Pseudomonas putida]MCI1037348.1 lipopolysaccharide biosynthesis protein [Pseudomonas putida]
MSTGKVTNALSSPVAASIAAIFGRFLLLGTGALTGIIIPMTMAQTSVGLFFLAQSLIAALATLGQLGLSITAPACISTAQGYRDGGQVKQILRRSLLLAALSTVALAVGFNIFMHVLSRYEGEELLRLLHGIAPLVSLSMIMAAISTILSEQHRALGHFVQASFLTTGASLASAATVILAWRGELHIELGSLILAGAVGAGCTTLLGAWSLRRWYRAQQQVKPVNSISYAALLRETRPNLTTTVVLFVMSQADLWIIAWFGDAAGLAIYGLASRLAALVLIPLAVINTVVAPSIGRIWVRGKKRYLQRVMGVGASAATVLGLTGYLLFILSGQFLLAHVWSSEYANAYYIFAILGVSQLAQTYAGPAGFVLMMLQKQHVAMRISVVSGICMIATGLLAMWLYGIIGLAVVYSLGGVCQSLAQIYCVKRIFNLNTTANYSSLRRFLRFYYRRKVSHGR